MNGRIVKEIIKSLKRTSEQIIQVRKRATSLGCVDGTIIGTGRSDYTRDSEIYNLIIEGKKFALIDIPGIEGDESAFEEIIKRSLERAHLIFYVNGAGKKIELESLKKIKKYMHDGTSVYAIFNTACKAKKNRNPDIDISYSSELEAAYNKQQEVVLQTEKELKTVLGNNYRSSICVNGLLAFCAVAFCHDKKTSIKEEEDKSLREDQQKYLNEYNYDVIPMRNESHISDICGIIAHKVKSFDSDIYEENLKKLKSRMSEGLEKIVILKREEIKKIKTFIEVYQEFENNCLYAKDDFIRTMRHVEVSSVESIFNDLINEIFNKIQADEGKTKDKEIEEIVEKRKEKMALDIQQDINKNIQKAQKTFIENIEDAQERMKTDFERGQIQFEVSLSSDSIALDIKFEEALKYSFGDLGKDGFDIVGLAITGGTIGSFICPGLGTIVGGGIGAILGVLKSIWGFFASKERRINNAQDKIRRTIDKQVEKISKTIRDELEKMSYEEKANDVYNSICAKADKQKDGLRAVQRILISIENEMKLISKQLV